MESHLTLGGKKYTISLLNITIQYNKILCLNKGKELFDSLVENDNIKVLDFSWNRLGENRIGSCIQSLCNMIKTNKTIIHMDLSNNDFSLEESKEFSECLKLNQSILGIHF